MIDIQPTDLRYFFEIAKTLNISRAAERLNVGQPALSQSLRRLETVVGAKLFDRFKSGVQLTAAGRRLLVEGRISIENWDRLKQVALSSDQEIEGRYSVGCHTGVGSYALPTFMKELMTEHQRLEINFTHGLSREMTEDVVSFRVDFGLVINPVRHPDLVIKVLCEDRVSFWKAKGALSETLIYDPALSQAQSLVKKSGRNFSRHMHSGSLEIVAILAQAGCGVALLPERIARRTPGLSLVDSGLPSVKDTLCLVYRADRHQTAAGRAIIDAISNAKI
jgi:DNA-binding transcriptional LysR family regulator